jgi:hypothetical protein
LFPPLYLPLYVVSPCSLSSGKGGRDYFFCPLWSLQDPAQGLVHACCLALSLAGLGKGAGMLWVKETAEVLTCHFMATDS